MRDLIDRSLGDLHHLQDGLATNIEKTYKVYFGLGQSINLIHSPEVFKVSLAGIKLGHYLVRSFDQSIANRSVLDLGTGSGVHALLMRKLGCSDITATDISKESIKHAIINELANFKDSSISFYTSNLFENVPICKFQTIIFNPPGWRTPSKALVKRLNMKNQPAHLPVNAMFFGDDVIMRFLEDLPRYLDPTGTAIVGLNSLVGIRDVLERYNKKYGGKPPLVYKLVERHDLPPIHYSHQWERLSKYLKEEFYNLAARDLAAYSTDDNGEIYWSYEIVEFSFAPRAYL